MVGKRRNPVAVTIGRTIWGSLGRYLAILAIIALGSGFFAGLQIARSAMVKTADVYLRDSSFYDFRLLSTLGFTHADVEAAQGVTGVTAAEGAVFTDFIAQDGSENNIVLSAHSITENINTLELVAGRMPEAANECVLDAYHYESSMLGEKILVSAENEEDTLDLLAYDSYTVVGLVYSPLYLNYERGSSAIGNGTVVAFLFMPRDGFVSDYDTELYVSLGSDTPEVYSQAYEDLIEQMEDPIELALESRKDARYEEVTGEARQELLDGQHELMDGWQEYATGKADGESKLAAAQKELLDARDTLDQGWSDYTDGCDSYDRAIASAETQLQQSKVLLDQANAALLEGQATYETEAANLAAGETAYQEGLAQYESGSAAYLAYLADYEAGKQQYDSAEQLYGGIAAFVGSGLTAESNPVEYTTVTAMLDGLLDQLVAPADYALREENLALLRMVLDQTAAELSEAKVQLDDSAAKLAASQAELAAARAALDDGQVQLAAAKTQLEQGTSEYEGGYASWLSGSNQLQRERANGKKTLDDSLQELQDGEVSYQDGLAEFEDGLVTLRKETGDALAELAENRLSLQEGWDTLSEVEPATIYVLGRSLNTGYACFDNDSQIVEGIARVFPMFFFLVAALVCITTMTRMVEDDRTQIGIMKALGYGNFSISLKYLIYAGSASLFGCIIGLSLGSWLIPKVLWKAYSIMYEFADIQFVFHWPRAILSTLGYLLCALGATWISCRGELRQVSAELIRPKSPKAGKRVLLERIPIIWKHLGFLQKVSCRNVFRYKKRLFMMIVGIGGCTALLLTGFGIRDSIQNFVGYQFDEITRYDCTVTFSEEMTESDQAAFMAQNEKTVAKAAFVHLSSVNVEIPGVVKSAYLVATDDDLTDYMDFHMGKVSLAYPDVGECLINEKLAQQFGLSVGDALTVYDADRNSLTMTVSGIFDNYINNYIYTAAGTLLGYGGNTDVKCAYVNLVPTADQGEALADLTGTDHVSGVSSNQALRERIDTMMSSLDYIVVFVTLCAGALAFIVLYNLTNINITERIREIATIKVLGFFEGETAVYVFRENLMLTALGALVGLPLGKLLHLYVMGQIQIDMMCFDVRIQLFSYVLAVALTLVFAGIVNFVMRSKIRRIDMAESLKSVE